MTDAPDAQLLDEFARNHSEAAFALLVQRYVALVHSVALRHTAQPQQAQDITQAVFIILARKAGKLGRKTILPGWLCHTARLTAANFQRAEARRIRREQEAFMQSILKETAPDPVWRELSPHLDAALAGLGTTDRDALVLRYFQNKSLPEVGAALGLAERATQKRVSRALEKLRKFFSKQGIALSPAAIATAVSAHSVQAAPAVLAQTITLGAVTQGATVTISTTTLVKGVLKLMAWTTLKTSIVVGAVVIMAAGTTAVAVKHASTLSATDLSWADNPKYWDLDLGDPDPQKDSAKDDAARFAAFNERLAGYPAVLILRPTRFKTNPGLMGSTGPGEKVLARAQGFVQMLELAYDPTDSSHVILPPEAPRGNFDLLLNLPALPPNFNNPQMALQKAIKDQYGIVAHLATIETNVLNLSVKTPGAAALQPTKGGVPMYPTRASQNHIVLKNQDLAGVAVCLHSLLKTRVINQTGIEGRFDIDLQWQPRPGETQAEAIQRAVREQLGLEFTPGHESEKCLIAEKVD